MQGPAMKGRFLCIFLPLLVVILVFAAPVEARLTLGISSDSAVPALTEEQARRFGAALADELAEEIVVKPLPDFPALRNWLIPFAMLDLALIETRRANEHISEMLVIGTVDPAGEIVLVARQGASGDLPLRALEALRKAETALWTGKEVLAPVVRAPVPVPEPAPAPEPPPIAETPLEPAPAPDAKQPQPLEHVPPLRPGKAWTPEQEPLAEDVLVKDEPAIDEAEPVAESAPLEHVPPLTPGKAWPGAEVPLADDLLTVSPPLEPMTPEDLPEEFSEPVPAELPEMPLIAGAPDTFQPPGAPEPPPLPERAAPPVKTVKESAPPSFAPDVPQVTPPLPVAKEEPTPGAEITVPKPPVAVVAPVAPTLLPEPALEVPTEVADAQEPVPAPEAPEPPVSGEVTAPPPVAPAEEPTLVESPDLVPEPPPEVADAQESVPAPEAPEPPAADEVTTPLPVKPVEDPSFIESPELSPVTPPAVADVQEPVSVDPEVPEEVFLPADIPSPEPVVEEPVTAPGSPAMEFQEAEIVESPEPMADFDTDTAVASVIAQPDIPQALRPPGVPIPRPRVPEAIPYEEDSVLVASLPKPLEKKKAWEPPQLLPEPEPEPKVVYIVPFVSIMVPREVETQLFDLFIEDLNERGKDLDLNFVILKEGLENVEPEWLFARKYVTGEIYAYVEDVGSTNTDLRSKARLVYHKAHKQAPEFAFEYPVRVFFENDRSTIEVERGKLADLIASTLADELVKTLAP